MRKLFTDSQSMLTCSTPWRSSGEVPAGSEYPEIFRAARTRVLTTYLMSDGGKSQPNLPLPHYGALYPVIRLRRTQHLSHTQPTPMATLCILLSAWNSSLTAQTPVAIKESRVEVDISQSVSQSHSNLAGITESVADRQQGDQKIKL